MIHGAFCGGMKRFYLLMNSVVVCKGQVAIYKPHNHLRQSLTFKTELKSISPGMHQRHTGCSVGGPGGCCTGHFIPERQGTETHLRVAAAVLPHKPLADSSS